MSEIEKQGLSEADLAAEGVTALPDKEVVSILDLNADIDLAIDAAAPIDLAVAANANVAAPIDAAVGANILSVGSNATALADQGVIINQGIDADAVASSDQTSTIDQSNDVVDDGFVAAADGTTDATAPAATTTDVPITGTVGDTVDGATGTVDGVTGTVGDTVGGVDPSSALSGDLLNVDVNVAADADIAAPIAGAVAANANVAAPIDAAVAANIGSVDSDAISVAQQDAIINQDITGSAEATTTQDSEINQ